MASENQLSFFEAFPLELSRVKARVRKQKQKTKVENAEDKFAEHRESWICEGMQRPLFESVRLFLHRREAGDIDQIYYRVYIEALSKQSGLF